MRVVLIAYAISPIRGSEQGNSWRLATGLAEAGHRVELLTSERFSEDWVGVAVSDNLRITVVPRDIPGGRLTRNAIGWYLRYAVFLSRSHRVATAMHAGQPFDVAHHFSWGTLAWGTPLWKLSVPTVFGPSGGGSFIAPELRSLFSRAQMIRERAREVASRAVRFNPLARRTVRHCTVLATNSDTAQLVRQLGGSAAVVSDASVPATVLEVPPLTLGERTTGQLVWTGRLIPLKAVDIALMAMRHLDAYHLVVIGDGVVRSHAEALAATLGVADRVTFTGALTWSDTIDITRRSVALLFTSTRDTFGAQLLEAGGAGTPIVAIDQHGTRDHVPSGAGVLVPVDSPERVAASIAEAVRSLENIDRWNSASRTARSFGESLSVEGHVATMVDVYADAISAYRSPSTGHERGQRWRRSR